MCNKDALKLCKPRQLVGIRGVRYGSAALFHRVIHTCVQNFTAEKYLPGSSAEVVLSCAENYLPLTNKYLGS
jgi:hypothetical protein